MYTFFKVKSALKPVFSRAKRKKVFGVYGGKMKFLKRKVIDSSCRKWVRQDKNKPG